MSHIFKVFKNNQCYHEWSPWEQHGYGSGTEQSRICIKCAFIRNMKGDRYYDCIRPEDAKRIREKYFKEDNKSFGTQKEYGNP